MKQELAKQVTRLGLQKLLHDVKEDQYYISIENRTYYSIHPIPKDKARIWANLLGRTKPL
jgi:hypothetical protein